jgi:hypothetical protein
MKVIERLFASFRNGSVITATGIIAIINVAIKAARTAEPWPSSDEQAAAEPIGSIVAIRSTAIRRIVEVTVGTVWGHSDVDADLSRCMSGSG